MQNGSVRPLRSAFRHRKIQFVVPYMFSNIPSAIIFVRIDFHERISEYLVYSFHHYLFTSILLLLETCTRMSCVHGMQSTPAHERGKLLSPTYGYWQTEDYVPPTAVDVSTQLINVVCTLRS